LTDGTKCIVTLTPGPGRIAEMLQIKCSGIGNGFMRTEKWITCVMQMTLLWA